MINFGSQGVKRTVISRNMILLKNLFQNILLGNFRLMNCFGFMLLTRSLALCCLSKTHDLWHRFSLIPIDLQLQRPFHGTSWRSYAQRSLKKLVVVLGVKSKAKNVTKGTKNVREQNLLQIEQKMLQKEQQKFAN